VSAALILQERGLEMKHYHPKMICEIEPSVKGRYNFKGDIVYDPKVCTKPFTGKLGEEEVINYIEANTIAYTERLVKYQGAKYLGLRAHALGLEDHVLGMAAPHNAIAVMVFECGAYDQNQVWNTIMAANHARNTYLYTRKGLGAIIELIRADNVLRAKSGEKVKTFMPWQKMERPKWYAFTKAQRKRIIGVLKSELRYGATVDQMSDQDLSILVTKAQNDPKYLEAMQKVADIERVQQEQERQRVQGSMVPTAQLKQDGESGKTSRQPQKERRKIVLPTPVEKAADVGDDLDYQPPVDVTVPRELTEGEKVAVNQALTTVLGDVLNGAILDN